MGSDSGRRTLERFLTVVYMVTQRLRICGRVQGVGYREALRFEAQRLGVTGWVRNRTDGSVEALLQGPAEKLHALTAWARRGPPAALVADLRVEDLEGHAERYCGFERRPTV